LLPFRPHPLLRGGNLQTIASQYFQKAKPCPPDEILSIQLSGGDETTIQINLPRLSNARTPVVVLFHDWGQSANSPEMSRYTQKLIQVGFRVARFNHRCCDGLDKAAKFYHFGSTTDIAAGITAVYNKWPDAPLFIAGMGLSGTVILNFLGSQPEITNQIPQIKRALVVSPTIDLEKTKYRWSLLRNLPISTHYNRKISNQLYINRSSPVSGMEVCLGPDFACLSEQISMSPKDVVAKITLPTQVIVAADDPFIPISTVTNAPFSDAVTVRIEKSGGYMGFITKKNTRYGDHWWLDDALVQWAEDEFAILTQNQPNTNPKLNRALC